MQVGTCKGTEGKVFANMSAGIDTKANISGGGAPQLGDLRLLEHGGERGGALSSDVVAFETVSEGQGGKR